MSGGGHLDGEPRQEGHPRQLIDAGGGGGQLVDAGGQPAVGEGDDAGADGVGHRQFGGGGSGGGGEADGLGVGQAEPGGVGGVHEEGRGSGSGTERRVRLAQLPAVDQDEAGAGGGDGRRAPGRELGHELGGRQVEAAGGEAVGDQP